jgi:class 3 adenylate cyclase
MKIEQNQIPLSIRDIIQEEIKIYNLGRAIIESDTIPDTKQIPLNNPSEWLKIPDIICVFVDMVGSTKLSANKYDKSTAGAYQLFTNTAVKIFHALDAPYIDVRGDGVFAMFNSNQAYRALVGALIFKTFVDLEFVPRIDPKIETGCHIGIDQKTVLVRKIGLKRINGRSDRQNEVWAGKPVNMAAKLASLSKHNEIMVSKRFYSNLRDEKATHTCDCFTNIWGNKRKLWIEKDVSHINYFDFDTAYCMERNWCKEHGDEYIAYLLSL